MKVSKKIYLLLVPCAICLVIFFSNSSCNIYKFHDRNPIPDTIKTVKVNFIENRAQYVNPQFGPRLTDKLRQKIIGQTKLSQTNSDNPDWEISGFVTDYSFSTSAISGQQVTNNRLTIAVHITFNKRKQDKVEEYDVSHSFEFSATKSIQQAELELNDEMVRSLTDEIFNKLFSQW